MKVEKPEIKNGAEILKGETGEPKRNELQALGAEIINLFYAQAFSPEDFKSEEDVCRAFAGILRQHWELCCIITYLRSDEGQLQACVVYHDEKLSDAEVSDAGARLAAAAEQAAGEVQIWPEARDHEPDEDKVRRAVERAGLRAAVAVPVHVHNALVAVLVVMGKDAESLREALKGIRFVAAPIVLAVGNARRASAYQEQRQRIELLVEDLQQHGAALEEANLELQRIARYRSLFLGRMSHELRTPLTSILGFAEILLDYEELTPAQRRFCEKIQASGLQLQTSLDHLVDLSRLEAGHSELFLHEFSLREIVREACAAVARLAQKQEVNLERRFSDDLQPVVSDGGKLRQILYNFLANAISRSSSSASVTISVEQADSVFFEIEICDEGEPFVNPAHLSEPADEAATADERGTNMNELGLVIAARLVKVLGGTLRLDEKPDIKTSDGKKSGFCVRLRFPFRPSEAATL